MSADTTGGTARNFAPTRWTLVMRATGESVEGRAALSELCTAYYEPVFVFLRRSGNGSDAARDLAHEFFARLLERGGLAGPDPARGRFRNYLLGTVKYFLRDRLDFEHRAKRGGGAVHESLISGEDDDTPALQVADTAASAAMADANFDREWAQALVNRAVAALEAEYAGKRAAQFAALQPCLMGDLPQGYDIAATGLGLSMGALKVAVHRMRQRFRELLKAEILQTLDDPAELDDEMRHLCAALARAE